MKYQRMMMFFLGGILLYSNLSAAEFRIVVRAKSGVDSAQTQWQPTVDLLNEKITKHHFVLVPIVGLDEITEAVAGGEFGFLLTNPSSYAEIEILNGAKALVTLNNKRAGHGQKHFGSVIFTHAKHVGITNLSDLKDKIVMGVSEQAFGGWRVAWLEMLEQGIDPYRELKQLLFAKDHLQQTVVYAVRDGKADVGVVRTDQLERMATAGKIDMRYFRILNNQDTRGFPFFLSTPLYPEWPFASLPKVPNDVAEQVKQVLLEIRPDSIAAQKGKYVGWVPPLDYKPVHQLMKRLKVGPYAP